MHDREEVIEKVLEGLRQGKPEYSAAQDAGCSFVTWWRWRREMTGLTERAAEAKLARVVLWEDALHKAAVKGSVTACLALLEKHDPEWRNRAKELAPQQNVLVLTGGAAHMLSRMPDEKKKKFLGALHMAGLLPDRVIDIKPSENGHGTNGSSAAH